MWENAMCLWLASMSRLQRHGVARSRYFVHSVSTQVYQLVLLHWASHTSDHYMQLATTDRGCPALSWWQTCSHRRHYSDHSPLTPPSGCPGMNTTVGRGLEPAGYHGNTFLRQQSISVVSLSKLLTWKQFLNNTITFLKFTHVCNYNIIIDIWEVCSVSDYWILKLNHVTQQYW